MPGSGAPPYSPYAQPGGAVMTTPYNAIAPGGGAASPPAGASPGMPGVTGPPFYGPPQIGGSAFTYPGTGHVPVINRLPPSGYPALDMMKDFLYPPSRPPAAPFYPYPPDPKFPDMPWYPPIMPDGPRMLPGTTPLAPAMISPLGNMPMYPFGR